MTDSEPEPQSACRPDVVAIDKHSEPLRRNWAATIELFQKDREALRRKDGVGCSALEMAESMERFLESGFQR